jgi:hypothetical protein
LKQKTLSKQQKLAKSKIFVIKKPSLCWAFFCL